MEISSKPNMLLSSTGSQIKTTIPNNAPNTRNLVLDFWYATVSITRLRHPGPDQGQGEISPAPGCHYCLALRCHRSDLRRVEYFPG